MWDLIFVLPIVVFSLVFYAMLFLRKEERYNENYTPHVTVHVPVYNDPIVKRLLKRLKEMDYPSYDVIVVDDYGDREVERLCKELGYTYVRRDSRKGYKGGALNHILPLTKGEVVVVFDADFLPERNFLREIVKPLEREDVAYAQGRWRFENFRENLVTVFAGSILSTYHRVVYPFLSRFGVAYISGSAFAIKREVLERFKWREIVLEDADLSVRILLSGYKGVYVPTAEALSQLPYTLKSYIIQQLRWVGGMVEVVVRNLPLFITSRVSLLRKFLVAFTAMSSFVYVAVFLYTLYLFAKYVMGTPLTPLEAAIITLTTSGYLVASIKAVKEEEGIDIIPLYVLSLYLIAPIVSLTNTWAVILGFLGKVGWQVTEKRL